MPRSNLFAAAVLATAAFCTGPAQAHSQFSAVIPFWSGALHFLVTPLSVAATIGLIAVLSASRDEGMLFAACLAGLVAMIAARYAQPAPAIISAGCALVTGLVAILGRTPGKLFASIVAAVSGVGIGCGTELDSSNWPAATGIAVAVAYVALSGIAALWALESRLTSTEPIQIGRRVVGAWVAAIGLLVGALALKRIGAA